MRFKHLASSIAMVNVFLLTGCGGSAGMVPLTHAAKPTNAKPLTLPIIAGESYAYLAEELVAGQNLLVVDVTRQQVVGTLALIPPTLCYQSDNAIFYAARSPVGPQMYFGGPGYHAPLYGVNSETASQFAAGEANGQDPMGITVSQDGTKVYETNGDNVTVYDARTLAYIRALPIKGAENNYGYFGVATAPTGNRAYFESGTNDIAVVDTSSDSVVTSYALPAITDSTHGTFGQLAVRPDGTQLFIAYQGRHELISVNASTGNVIWTAPTITSPNALTINHAGTRLYVINTVPPFTLYVVDPSNGDILNSTVLGGQTASGITISDDDRTLYVPNGTSLLTIDARSAVILNTLRLPQFVSQYGQFVNH